jgi:PTH1 family peptidyl-tRNA hydrolase
MYVIVGLGNPGEEYEHTRHNAGRLVVERVRAAEKLPEWHPDGKLNALVSKGKVANENAILVLPETYMNKSGSSVKPLITSAKAAERLIVVHDELDMPLGTMKISFARSSGGHRGVESIIRALKTEKFVRVRVGVSPATPSGKLKKPQGEKKVVDFILKPFTPKEREALKKTERVAVDAIRAILAEGRERAMNRFN